VDIEGVGVRHLEDGEEDGRLAVETDAHVVAFGAQLDAGDVAEPHHPPVRQRPQDDALELADLGESAERAQGELERRGCSLARAAGLCRGHGRLPDGAGGDLDVLLADGADDVTGRQVPRGQPTRVDPDAHAVVALAEEEDVTHARHARQLVAHLQHGVVGQVELVIAAVRRGKGETHEDIGRAFARGHAGLLDDVGELRQGEADPVLHQDLRHVQVDAVPEGDRQVVGAVVGALRGHVHHALDAVDLLLDRGGDGLGDILRAGAGIVGRHLHRRRRYRRKLRQRQREDGNPAGQGDDDGQHRGEDRPIDEEP
jgi:hypothetical protein